MHRHAPPTRVTPIHEAATTDMIQEVVALLPAAGRGRRFGSQSNKIWASLGGQTVLERTLSVFQTHPRIASIVVIAGADEVEQVRVACHPFAKVSAVVVGGETRADSVRNGLEALPPTADVVLVHDAARPLLSAELIDRLLAGVEQVGAAVPGLPLSDTVKRVDAESLIRATIPRSEVYAGETLSGLTAVQTPQGARVELLRAAYAAFDFAHAEPTDEASLLAGANIPVTIVQGDPTNIKITRPEDIALAERLLSEVSPEIRTGFGYDVHRFAAPEAQRPLFLGGIEIPHHQGLEGHSDADVLLHAVCDALLGAASLGDIGILFPNTDPTYKNISSLKLLEVVRDRLQEAGWEVVNVDVTVVAEAPKLMPHRERMQETIAASLRIAPSRLSVKATTSERMGFVGRQEGMACWAIATIRSQKAVGSRQ